MKSYKLELLVEKMIFDEKSNYRRLLRMVDSRHFADDQVKEYFINFCHELSDAIRPFYFDEDIPEEQK